MTAARDDARGLGARVVPLRPGDGRDGDGLAGAIADRLGARRDRVARYYGRARHDAHRWLAETVAAVLAAPELRAPARLVLVALAAEIAAATARDRDPERERGPGLIAGRSACAPILDLARATALSPRAVETALADLVRRGAVIRAARTPGRPTVYRVDVAALSPARRRRTPRMACATSPAPYAGGTDPSPARSDDDAADLARRRILSARLTPAQRAAALAALDRWGPT